MRVRLEEDPVAYHPDYDYDVFISYSPTNNCAGWVSRFEEKLTARLCERLSKEVRVFRSLRTPQDTPPLTVELRGTVERSAVFLPIVSRDYLACDECVQECAAFLAANPHGPGRPFPVRYDDVSPAKYQQLLGRDVHGYPFFSEAEWRRGVNALDTESTEFKYALDSLREDIGRYLEERVAATRLEPRNADSRRNEVLASAATEPVATILLAEPPPALAKHRNELFSMLRDTRIKVLQPGAGFYEGAGFEASYDVLLSQADLFVQLLGPQFLPHDDRQVHSWDRWQYQRAVAANKPVQRWFLKFDPLGRELDLAQLDAAHRAFIKLNSTWDYDFHRFKQLVAEDAQRRRLERDREQARHQGAAPLLVIRADKSDQQIANEIGERLEQQQCKCLRLSAKDSLSLESLARRLAAQGLLIVYGACPGVWLLQQLQGLRKFRRTEIGLRWSYGLWNEPLEETPLSCQFDGLMVIDPRDETTLRSFLAHLRQFSREQEVVS
jgi:hypothetical protein